MAPGRSAEFQDARKVPDLRIVLMGTKANTRMREHPATARVSLHLLNGDIRLHLPEQVVDLTAGHLPPLDQCVSHEVEAPEDRSSLLTLSCHREEKPRNPGRTGRKRLCVNGNSGSPAWLLLA